MEEELKEKIKYIIHQGIWLAKTSEQAKIHEESIIKMFEDLQGKFSEVIEQRGYQQKEITRLVKSEGDLVNEIRKLRAAYEAANKRADTAEREVREYEEREADCCPENVGFETVIQNLRESGEQLRRKTDMTQSSLRSYSDMYDAIAREIGLGDDALPSTETDYKIMEWIAKAKAAEAEITRLRMVLRGIHEMADEDIRVGNATSATCVWQIEADARAALKSQ